MSELKTELTPDPFKIEKLTDSLKLLKADFETITHPGLKAMVNRLIYDKQYAIKHRTEKLNNHHLKDKKKELDK